MLVSTSLFAPPYDEKRHTPHAVLLLLLQFFEDWTRVPAALRMRAWNNEFTVLKSLPQVLVTPHIAFLTREALAAIADTTVQNLKAAAQGLELTNEVKPPSP